MPQSVKRKLMKHGKSSLVVALPKGWLDYKGLHSGDQVEVITNEDVTIRPVQVKKKKGGGAS